MSDVRRSDVARGGPVRIAGMVQGERGSELAPVPRRSQAAQKKKRGCCFFNWAT